MLHTKIIDASKNEKIEISKAENFLNQSNHLYLTMTDWTYLNMIAIAIRRLAQTTVTGVSCSSALNRKAFSIA